MEPCSQSERIAKMEQQLNTMVESINKLSTAVSALVKFETEIKAIDEFKLRHSSRNYKLIGVIIGLSSLLLASIGTIVTILTYKP